MSAVYVAWLLAAWVVIGLAAREALTDLLRPRRDDDQQSWSIPEQRVSGWL